MKFKKTLAIMIMPTMVLTACGGTKNDNLYESTVASEDVAAGTESASVETTENNDTPDYDEEFTEPEQLKVTDNILTLPDGRNVEYVRTLEDNGTSIFQSCDVTDRTLYSEDGLIDRFHNLDIKFSANDKEYYFKCEMIVDNENKSISFENVDTNLIRDDSYSGINIYNTDEFVSIAFDNSSLEFGKLDMIDNETLTINGTELKYSEYFKGFRDTMATPSVINARLFSNGYQVNVGDIWVDKDDTNFGFIIDYMEADEYKNWRPVDPGSIEIGYSMKLMG